MRLLVIVGCLIMLTNSSNAHARQGDIGGADEQCTEGDLSCPSRVVANRDRERALSERPVDLRSWLYNREDSQQPPAQRDDASGSADLMVVHPAGNVVWMRW